MIPSILAQYIEQGIKDFLRTTFPITTPLFPNILENFMAQTDNLFKGPYLDIQLPFQQGNVGNGYFPDLPMPFPPYRHQEIAFERLANARSSIVATGTGSGKTECFIYPILDYCYRNRGNTGIKAILIYPMNALATDQAGRLAKLIHNNSTLKGHITAGIYVGQGEESPSLLMSGERLISNKDTLRLSPPDILLTNYKMLDYLLIRPSDRALWLHNSPETLRFLVVDELHSFNGAQGSDLACLIRRLKARLNIKPDYLCCVGTSATLGTHTEQKELLEYACSIFGEKFDNDAIISESRLSAAEFLADSLISNVDFVPSEKANALDPTNYDSYSGYIKAQHRLWFNQDIDGDFNDSNWRIVLGITLKELLFFQNLLKILNGKIQSFNDIFSRMEKVTKHLKDTDLTYKINMLNSLIALISEARINAVINDINGIKKIIIRPFLNVRIQLWMRELGRMIAEVSNDPKLRFADDLNEEQLKTHLPLVHCRECGSMGWSGLRHKNGSEIVGTLKDYYSAFFSSDPKVVYLFPENEQPDLSISKEEEFKQIRQIKEKIQKDGMVRLCAKCMNISYENRLDHCPFCNNDKEGLIPVYMPDVRRTKGNRQISIKECPYCGSKDCLTILGSRAASLTSVMIVQLYSSTYNNDKRLLTFSDNVQDAAHRAGFFNARTFRFNFRTALQKVVNDSGDGKTLAELPKTFIDYWSNRIDQNRYIATFLAPNMEWLSDYDYLKNNGTLPKDSDLMECINNRIMWEIISEYGFQARIGRTLEKTGSSIAYLDTDQLNQAIGEMLENIQNEIGTLKNLDRHTLTRFVLGIVIRLKNQGGIYIPALDSFIENDGAPYLFNKTLWMPNFGSNSKTPSFLTTKNNDRFDQLFGSTLSHPTWYQTWLNKCLSFILAYPKVGGAYEKRIKSCIQNKFFMHDSLRISYAPPTFGYAPFIQDLSKEFYNLVLKGLLTKGIFEQKVVKSDTVWGINHKVLRVSSSVKQFRCRICGHNISAAEQEAVYFEDLPCQRFYCYGKYEPFEVGVNYYNKLYSTGDVERIFAKEHTGLLKRDERENLEKEFKSTGDERKAWYPNLLSCTPTLEMGIDIGNLSSLILCSVPPSQSNYLQRIGRAGRKDGNALGLTVVNAKPHDLFFFAEPIEMLAGHVDAPGIFLDASAVLERQFTAFCFDNWIASDTKAFVPNRLSQVLNNLNSFDQTKFPHNFIHYIEENRIALFDKFLTLFKNSGIGLSPELEPSSELSPESKSHLKIFVEGNQDCQDSLHYRIMNRLHSRGRESDSLRKKALAVNAKIKRKKIDPKDKNFENDLNDLNIEKSALQSLVRSIGERDTFNFFTDEGLLPNYAFPEAGVMLNSIIHRKKIKVQRDENVYDSWTYEYERPAVSALEELAPANTFYAEGRKVKIDRVDMSLSEIQTWRFCDKCSHKEMIGKDEEKSVCINCGSPMWGDVAQKRLMLKMRQVFALTSDKQSRISDDSDDRTPVFYNKQMLVEFNDKYVLDAYKVDADLPFGFDFFSNVDFCEINFGEKTEIAEKVSIAGMEMPRKGFRLCRICGKVQEENKVSHALTCKAINNDSDKNFIDCIYLYRQFVSEAIRILLPVDIISDSKRKLQSFIAALQLGLKKKFRGKIDHLQTTVHEEPLADSSFKRKFLILYDTVPGGTGYLKQLMRSPNQLMEVLGLSLETLKSCSCNQDETKDGCYSCLFAYRSSYTMPETSRTTAIELLAGILTYRNKLVRIRNVLEIPVNTLIESELELKFLETLKSYNRADFPLMLKKDLVNGKPGYSLRVKDKIYNIEPQVSLGEPEGISIQSRADFVIRPARLKDRIKPVAVFLDGFNFHKERIGLDMAQRMAIVQSGKFHIWSLTWRDIENKLKFQGHFFEDFMELSELPSGNNFNNLLKGYGFAEYKRHIKDNSFDFLIHFLEDPNEEKWQKFMFVVSLLHFDPQKFGNDDSVNDWNKGVTTFLPEIMAEKIKESGSPNLYGHFNKDNLKQYVIIEKKAVNPINPFGVKIGCWLNDDESTRNSQDFQSFWNGFLRQYNFYQFLPYAYFVTSEGNKARVYDSVELFKETSSDETKSDNGWNELKDLVDHKLHKLLDLLKENAWPKPEAGYEFQGKNGEIIATAELAWEELKIAFLIDEEMKYESKFVDLGWKVWAMKKVVGDPQEVVCSWGRKFSAPT